MKPTTMNEVYNAEGKTLVANGFSIGVIKSTRLKYGNRVIQLSLDDGSIYDVTEEILWTDKIQLKA